MFEDVMLVFGNTDHLFSPFYRPNNWLINQEEKLVAVLDLKTPDVDA